MDPLSITTSVFALVDVALKLKDSIDRVSTNRKQLRHLAEDIVQTLNDLQGLCGAREYALRGVPELYYSLNRLQSQLLDCHTRCEKTFGGPSRPKSVLAKAKYGLKQWLNADDIEEDICRLKEQIQTCLLRFTTVVAARTELISAQTAVTSARIEHSVLVLKTQQRAHINQFDRLYGRGFTGPDKNALPQPALFHNIDREYLHLKMIAISEAFETQDIHRITMTRLPLSDSDFVARYPPPFGVYKELQTFKGTIAKTWEVLQLLERPLEQCATLDCALTMLWVGCELHALGLHDDAVVNDGCAVQILRMLCLSPRGKCFLPYLGYALVDWNWTMGDDPEALGVCKEAVEVFASSANASVEQPANHVYALRSLAARYLDFGEPSEALKYFQNALQIIRSVDRSSSLGYDHASTAVVSDTGVDSWTSASTPEEFIMLQHECLVLFGMSNALDILGRRLEAFDVGRDAVDAFAALEASTRSMPSYIHLLSELLSQLRNSLLTWAPVIDSSSDSSVTIEEVDQDRSKEDFDKCIEVECYGVAY